MSNCIFCKIVAKQIPSSVVYEDEEFLAFKDIHPAAPVHFLIIPKQHVETLSDTAAEHVPVLGKMLALVPRLAQEQGCGLGKDAEGNVSGGYKTLINTGPDGGQEVYHLHIHVIGGPQPWRGQR
ncbi:histidine triad nucleotide-binding protein [Undibacterium sp. Jales W-56]|uniref:histidine triad nucleotide-binding protein n=1 Tax=Undibacterium sp. Jales W-56 TaxID=2897325 RepID=UPI0021D07BFA|nr:histidine triad nucleotide-binding protein [Undibacterium sp. Jales W-56]MCU6435109.1 histidine triad nucleotide-binding protein [Undibacterium sp. Jales W-56]